MNVRETGGRGPLQDTLPEVAREPGKGVHLRGEAAKLLVADWETEIAPLFRTLEIAPLSKTTIQDWLSEWSRLEELLEEAQQLAVIAYAADTRVKEHESAYVRFMTEIVPKHVECRIRLARRALGTGQPTPELATTFRRFQAEVSIFRSENAARWSELRALEALYQKIMGSLVVELNGRSLTIPELQLLLESPDRLVREQALRLEADACLTQRDELNALLDRMLDLRTAVARQAGFQNYRDYAFLERQRFDYSPSDCARFRSAIEEVVVPALARVYTARKRRLGVSTLRPWDVRADRDDEPQVVPFRDVETLVDRMRGVIARTDRELGDWFATIADLQLLDLESRVGKAPGAYCVNLSHQRLPFLFMNAVGTTTDVMTLLHEAGHGFHELAAREHPFIWQRQPSIEAGEMASMAMELLAARHLPGPDGFFSEGEWNRVWRAQLEEILYKLVHVASVDAFQHWLYTSPHGANAQARDSAWLAIRERFEPVVDWRELRRERTVRWYRQAHIFAYPFYYIEYGIAQIAALQLWAASELDSRDALAHFKRAMSLGASVPLPEIYATAGARFAFDAEVLAPLVARVEAAIEALT